MILTAANLRDFFRDAILKAKQNQTVSLSESLEKYLVHLLCDFSRTERAFTKIEPETKHPTLLSLLTKAQETRPSQAIEIYRYMGDISLYWLGFFEATLKQRKISKDYYMVMGSQAYLNASQLIAVHSKGQQSALYHELSQKFHSLVSILQTINFKNTNNHIQ